MYHIAICDDELRCLQEICELVAEILLKMRVEHKIFRYDRVEAVEKALADGEKIHLLLLDILMGKTESGMHLAQRLRKDVSRISIVLISASTDFILSGYDVQAIKYIVKPVDRNELRRAIQYDYETNFRKNYFVTGDLRGIPFSDIFYLETVGKKTAIYLEKGCDYYPGRIVSVLPLLPQESFYRCHQSFLINLDNVVRIVRYDAYLKDGRKVPVSKRYYKSVLEAFLFNLENRR